MQFVIQIGGSSVRVLAQQGHFQKLMPDGKNNAATLLKVLRDATARFQDVSVPEAEGYVLGCVSGSDSGAMGLHYVNSALVNSGILDPTRPRIVIYEPMSGDARV